MIIYPNIDPVIVSIGPFAIRWYALSYIVGFLLGLFYAIKLTKKHNLAITKKHLDDFLNWAVISVILGGRLGYVLFYQLDYYMAHPELIFAIWKGGMSFHGAMLGLLISIIIFCNKKMLPALVLTDILTCVAPIGLGLGRISNFINAELYGRVTNAPWGVLFPNTFYPRHPSQIYEAILEGFLLFVILFVFSRKSNTFKRRGFLTGTFLSLYAICRIIVEFFREPDLQLGLFFEHFTMGQILSIPMFLAGLFLIFASRRFLPKQDKNEGNDEYKARTRIFPKVKKKSDKKSAVGSVSGGGNAAAAMLAAAGKSSGGNG